ncbi:hypothetical protein Y88_3689 [Novosphingobium nitrogenifigens DSM 19370]|uniref:Uncharacterized protein n=1 Tax=Novosphingobium nitrogenifigens DSM 19370 TaxID=983920 RepID=F1ZDN6_9SPHN|nr:hypothetical protein [Novosphingobium nitrogenifigens]EGD57380.1 hypothetical protein Y88_3689 [Novosphingobium nitrogenifigens DSM 19370]
MSRKSAPSSRGTVHYPLPRLPHPSWRMAAAGEAARAERVAVSAEDFWNRLGL